MPSYEYRCRGCGYETELLESKARFPCSSCDEGIVRRVFSFTINGTFKPHYNHSVGEHVSTDQEFRDALKRRAEEQSTRTGIDHSYTPVYPGDMPMPDQGTEVFETRNRIVKEQGLDMPEVT